MSGPRRRVAPSNYGWGIHSHRVAHLAASLGPVDLPRSASIEHRATGVSKVRKIKPSGRARPHRPDAIVLNPQRRTFITYIKSIAARRMTTVGRRIAGLISAARCLMSAQCGKRIMAQCGARSVSMKVALATPPHAI
jgi:hypothetical protein